MLNSHWL